MISPAVLINTATSADPPRSIHTAADSPDLNTSILIVDDEPTTRFLLSTAMKKEGYHIWEASNGEDGIKLFQQQQPDIVLMDARMPKMDGFECCATLQAVSTKGPVPVLMITALDDPESVDKAFSVGASDYATKPIHWALLRQRVRCLQEAVKRRQAEQQIKASLLEKEAMLKEIHHRVKNNLQIISSLLNLQSKSIEDRHILDLFRDSQNRIRLMALIHEKLYQSEDLGSVNLKDYIQGLASYLLQSYSIDAGTINLSIQVSDIFVAIDTAVPCGLIINELVSNSLKYAFPKSSSHLDRTAPENTIEIDACTTAPDQFSIHYKDNGVGLPPNFEIETSTTLGLQIISSLTEQLEGSLAVTSTAGHGAAFTFTHLSIPK
ncbi:MAG: histidine kinase dimerization/phosphoacceptor domain -containing protein [Cyanobacteria bacterium J06598_1]